jgi:hypothetical protein
MADEKKKAAPKKAAAKKTEAKAEAKPGPKCSIEGCKRPYRAKSFCVTHYKLWRRGELEGHKPRYKTCSKEGCRKPVTKHGLCEEHGRAGAEAGGEAAAAPEAAPAA